MTNKSKEATLMQYISTQLNEEQMKAWTLFLEEKGVVLTQGNDLTQDLAEIFGKNKSTIEEWVKDAWSQFKGKKYEPLSSESGGGKLNVNGKEMEDAFNQHKQYKNQRTTSHYLLLFYAVECGLKASYMKKFNIKSFNHAAEELGTHNLNVLIQKVGIPKEDIKNCPSCHTYNKHEELLIEQVHQAWRYGVRIKEPEQQEVVNWLIKLTKYIEDNLI